MAKNIRRFSGNLFKYYFLNIVVNVNFFSDFNITASTAVKYYHNLTLNEKLELMGYQWLHTGCRARKGIAEVKIGPHKCCHLK